MAFFQYTKCVPVEDHSGKTVFTLAVIGAIVVLLMAGLLNPYFLVAALLAIMAYCHWWLYQRLICLGGQRCAIGLLGNVEPPEDKSFPNSLDTDYSINLILAPHQPQEKPPEVPIALRLTLHHQIADDGIQGDLIREQSATADADYEFQGYFSSVGGPEFPFAEDQPYLHCEFEGGGVKVLYDAAKAALALAVVASVFCAIPIVGWVVCAILSIISLIVIVVGLFSGLADTGKPSVFDPKTGNTLTTLENLHDILFVYGEWVYDTAHEGWNEIHPLRACQLVAKAVWHGSKIDWDEAIAPFMVMTGKWSFDMTDPAKPKPVKTSGPPTTDDWKAWVKSWCDAVTEANHPDTKKEQEEPENEWEEHCDIDGCRQQP